MKRYLFQILFTFGRCSISTHDGDQVLVQTTLDGEGGWASNKGLVVQGEIDNLQGLAGTDFEQHLKNIGLDDWALKYQGKSIKETEFYKGIPFGTVNQRFEKAVPYNQTWSGVLDLTSKETVICAQPDENGIKGVEDCLVLDVYKPVINTTNLLPVSVFIHGGSFIAGHSSEYRFQTVSATQERIVVSINYRLGFLGFASLGDSNMIGNAGLWDQRLGLEWVFANIHAFGGNKNDISIFGESAGSASVTAQVIHEAHLQNGFIGADKPEYKFHYLDESSSSLFRKATAESGSVTASWGNVKFFKLYNQINGFHGWLNTYRPDLYNETTVNTKNLADAMKNLSLSEIFTIQTVLGQLSPAPIAWGDFFGYPQDLPITEENGLDFWKYIDYSNMQVDLTVNSGDGLLFLYMAGLPGENWIHSNEIASAGDQFQTEKYDKMVIECIKNDDSVCQEAKDMVFSKNLIESFVEIGEIGADLVKTNETRFLLMDRNYDIKYNTYPGEHVDQNIKAYGEYNTDLFFGVPAVEFVKILQANGAEKTRILLLNDGFTCGETSGDNATQPFCPTYFDSIMAWLEGQGGDFGRRARKDGYSLHSDDTVSFNPSGAFVIGYGIEKDQRMVMSMLDFQFNDGSACDDAKINDFGADICELRNGTVSKMADYMKNEMIILSELDDIEKITSFANQRGDKDEILAAAEANGLLPEERTTSASGTIYFSLFSLSVVSIFI